MLKAMKAQFEKMSPYEQHQVFVRWASFIVAIIAIVLLVDRSDKFLKLYQERTSVDAKVVTVANTNCCCSCCDQDRAIGGGFEIPERRNLFSPSEDDGDRRPVVKITVTKTSDINPDSPKPTHTWQHHSTSTATPTNTPVPPTSTPTNTPTSTPKTPAPTNTPTSTPKTPGPTNTPTSTPKTPAPTNTPTSTPKTPAPTHTPLPTVCPSGDCVLKDHPESHATGTPIPDPNKVDNSPTECPPGYRPNDWVPSTSPQK